MLGFKRFMQKFWGWSLIVVAAVGIGTEWDNVQKGKQHDQGVGIVMITLFGAGGLALLRRGYAKDGTRITVAAPQDERADDAVIACIERLGGRVTITDVASELGLGFTETKKALNALERDGSCTTETVEGVVYYDFSAKMRSASSARLKNRIGGPQ